MRSKSPKNKSKPKVNIKKGQRKLNNSRIRSIIFVLVFALAGAAALIISFADSGYNPSAGRPFSASSAWNVPIGNTVELDPNSSLMVQNLRQGSSANTYEFGIPIYNADASTPRKNVRCTMEWGTCNVATSVPLTSSMKPHTGSDGAMIVIDWPNRKAYEFWQYNWNNGNPITSWGDTANIDGDGRGSTSTGAGISRLAGIVRSYEISSQNIDHALVFSSRFCARDEFRYPATKTDGSFTGTGAVPEGSRVQLDPAVAVDSIAGITPAEKAVAKALQKYGAYIMDCGESPMAFSFELLNDATGPNNVGSIYQNAGLQWDYYNMPNIPWSKLRVLKAWNSHSNSSGSTGTGLKGSYYNNADLTNLVGSRVDPQINFSWGPASPYTNVQSNTFSVRWTGTILAPKTGVYNFWTQSDDGIRVWINGQLLINNWQVQSMTERKGSISLNGNTKYSVRIEYFDNTYAATSKFLWQTPGGVKSLVPKNNLYPQ